MSLRNISHKSVAVDPRVDALITKHKDVSREIVASDEWLSELSSIVNYVADRTQAIESEISAVSNSVVDIQAAMEMDATLVRNDIDELIARLDQLERPAAPVHPINAKYDDRGLKDLISAIETISLETANHVDAVSSKIEADIRQMRVDLLRVVGKVQVLEFDKSSPWYQRLLFWKRK